jgi:hypothetical protein
MQVEKEDITVKGPIFILVHGIAQGFSCQLFIMVAGVCT